MEKARQIAHLTKMIKHKIRLADWYERKQQFGAVEVLENEIAFARKRLSELK